MDDPRNTDNAWIETVAVSIHFPDQSDVELKRLNSVCGLGFRLGGTGAGVIGALEGPWGQRERETGTGAQRLTLRAAEAGMRGGVGQKHRTDSRVWAEAGPGWARSPVMIPT